MTMLKSIDPATGEVVGEVEVTPADQIGAIVARARAAQAGWGALDAAERAEVLAGAGKHLMARAEEVARLITREMGKPYPEALGEAKHVASTFSREPAEIAEALAPEVIESSATRSTVYHDPVGVTACIAPWNFPVMMPHWQVLPALMAGNAVVLKPSEETPLSGQAYADALLAVLPEDVLQVIHGGDAQGKALVAADVDLVVFTGSRAAGQHILAECSKGLKRVILELGGKDPLIVLDDADVDAAAAFAARNAFRNAGQVCVSTERIYAEDAIHDRFVEALGKAAAKLVVGPGLDEGVNVGPMVHARQRAHVLSQVDAAVRDGATMSYAGDKRDGNFLSPIVLTGVTHEMEVAREETFGPVACVTRVGSDDEAVELANDTPYGLGAVVYGSAERARAVARRLTAGMIGINQGISSAGSTPWVGARQSGYGFHSGKDGHRQFAQTRVVSEALK